MSEREQPIWDWKANGLLFGKDVDDALKLKAGNPAAFKSSVRAQKIVAYAEQSVKWQVGLTTAGIRAFANRPRALRDLSVARDQKRKPRDRFAAIERFASLFGEIPYNVAIALFGWLHSDNCEREARKNGLIKALNRSVVAFKIDSQTGKLIADEKRGQKGLPQRASCFFSQPGVRMKVSAKERWLQNYSPAFPRNKPMQELETCFTNIGTKLNS